MQIIQHRSEYAVWSLSNIQLHNYHQATTALPTNNYGSPTSWQILLNRLKVKWRAKKAISSVNTSLDMIVCSVHKYLHHWQSVVILTVNCQKVVIHLRWGVIFSFILFTKIILLEIRQRWFHLLKLWSQVKCFFYWDTVYNCDAVSCVALINTKIKYFNICQTPTQVLRHAQLLGRHFHEHCGIYVWYQHTNHTQRFPCALTICLTFAAVHHSYLAAWK